jgi:uncharacterized protein involved in copper resistance
MGDLDGSSGSVFISGVDVMRTNSLIAASIVALGLAFSVSVPIAAAQPAGVTDTQVASAKTAADHEAIATAYDAEATAADQKAAEHAAMAKAYRNLGQKGSAASMSSHCNRLIEEYRAAAKEYRSLAAEHREMAKTVK